MSSSKSTLAINLKKLMEKAHISEQELSRRTNVAQPIINRILKGENKNPKLLTLKPIADYFTMTVSELIGEKEIDHVWSGFTLSQHHGLCEIPIINWKKMPLSQECMKKQFIFNDMIVSKKAFALYVTDEDMQPIVPKNSIVIIEPTYIPKTGDLIALQNKKNNIIIRNYIQANRKHFIHSNNNDLIELKNPEKELLGTIIRILYDPRIKR